MKGVECGVGVWLGCRSVCGAQCVAVVLVISRAGIGPKPDEVRANARREKGKRYSACFIVYCYDYKRSNAKLFLALGCTRYIPAS